MGKEKFAPDEYYHIYSRILLNTPLFKDNTNAKRLAQGFLLANSTRSTEAFNYLRNTKNATIENAMQIAREGEKLVDVVCYAIMFEHYHVLLKELKEGGIINFIHKSDISIAKYINIKTKRRGPLFESRFKSKHIDSNQYLLHLSLYIHLNPLDFIDGSNWRNHQLKDWDIKIKKLLDYPWSSLKEFLYNDFKDPIISGEDIILGQFNGTKDYEEFLKNWANDASNNINNIKDLIFE